MKLFNKMIAPLRVGTSFMASGDSSPWREGNPGGKGIERVQGDESNETVISSLNNIIADTLKTVPTPVQADFLKRGRDRIRANVCVR